MVEGPHDGPRSDSPCATQANALACACAVPEAATPISLYNPRKPHERRHRSLVLFWKNDDAGTETVAMSAPPCVWIVVLNWNGIVDTLACLESLRRLDYAGYRIVVVDNGSTDGSVETLRQESLPSTLEIVETGRNLGYAGGNNVGIRYALDRGADFILLLNNDTTVDPMLLDELLGAAERHPAVGCFGPWIFYMHEPDRLWFSRSEWSPAKSAFTAPGKGRPASEVPTEPADTEYVCGAALFFRAEVAREIGLFDERFFLVYEDSDWCFRARRAGFGCMMVPAARVWHRIGTSFSGEASPLRTYFSTRNNLLWGEKNVARDEWWRMLRGVSGRLLPRLGIDRTAAGPMHKTLLWAVNGFVREWSRKLQDPQEVAYRRGVFDYVFRRFGDCPSKIHALTQTWASAREAADVSSSLGS
jgi:GT2 family glycosyltransferase